MGQYEKAEPLYLESKDIWEKALGKGHSHYAANLNNLANLYRHMGQYEKAEPLYLESKDIWEKAVRKESPQYAASLNNLANLYGDMGQYEKAEPLYLELSSVNKRLLEKASLHLSERELNIYLNTLSAIQNKTLSFTHTTGSKLLIPTCYDNSLFYKGFLLQSAGRIRQLALSDTAATEKFNRLIGYQRRLAAQYTQPIAKRDSALVAQRETLANDLEKDLTRTVAGYGQAKQQVTWQDVQAALEPGEAAVEFVHYRFEDEKSSDSTFYAALVLHPGLKQPAFIPLFEEKSLDSLLHTQGERKADYVNSLYTVAERGAKPLGKPQKSLYELLWQPLEKDLAGVKTIYFSPSGLLHRLNLGAVPIPPSVGGRQGEAEEETLGDHYQLVEMGSTRQLVVPHPLIHSENTAMLFGGIQYEMDSIAMAQANLSLGSDVLLANRGGLSFANTDSTLRGGTWSYLIGDDEREVTVPWSVEISERAEIRREIVVLYDKACAILGVPARPHE
jgi:tetratricopeptide (TPR) repeat protein